MMSGVDDLTAAVVAWLLASDEPAVRSLARRDLLDEQVAPADASGPWMNALLDWDPAIHPYRKWTGAHWRLASVVELGVSPTDERVRDMVERVLTWQTGTTYRKLLVVDGLPRRHASMEGNALAAVCRLGLATDPRARLIAESLVEWQWPDGGWNCDPGATHRSSFHETFLPMWALHEYAAATGDGAAAEAASRAAELLLEHRLFRSPRTGEVINKRWLEPRYPPYWHYDFLQALLLLARIGKVRDPRAGDALDELERQRLPDGRWRPKGFWWKPPGSTTTPEAVDWGRSGPNEMVTLNALRVLKAAGRLT
jgi:hypothetical protein